MNKQPSSFIVANLGWSFSSKILAQGIAFVVSLVLARLLSPDEYGEIALVQVFINIANVFVVAGFGEALVQKKDISTKDYSTIFWCALTISIGIYIFIFLLSPLIAGFYKNQRLIPVIRVLGAFVPLSSLNTVQNAYISRNMLFNVSFWSMLFGTLISGAVGIVTAYCGWGVWALVAQQLVNIAINALVLLITLKWRPSFYFDSKVAKKLIGFSWKITGASLINEVYSQFRSIIVGKKYSTADLAYYNKGDQFPNLFIANINNTISAVFFPVMARLQDDTVELKRVARQVLQLSSYIIFPCMTGLMAVGDSLIYVLLGEKWMSCVPYLRILGAYWMMQPIQTINWQIIKSLGRSDLCLKLEAIKKIIGVSLLLFSMNLGVTALAWVSVATGGLSALINMLPNVFLVKYTIREQIKDIVPTLLLSGVMGVLVYCLSFIEFQFPVVLLLFQIVTGIVFYFVASYILKLAPYRFLIQYIRAYGSGGN